MRLTSKLIEEAVSEAAGEDVLPLVKLLKNRKNVSEFKLADSVKQEVNVVRNMLYRLYNVNLVSFIRKKDKKKGWYIYYWTFESRKVKYLLQKIKAKRLQRLKSRLEREKQSSFFACPNQCVRLDFDQATNFEFKCPECGEIINQEDNTEKIKQIEEEIKELEKDLKKK
ncbi:transcription factor [Candidatus Woesearchaeota archaeon]|nr:transcription factor [Candidatus Woesearchaeota archaeon]